MGQLFAVLFGLTYGLSNVFASKAVESDESHKFAGQYITLLINSGINIVVLAIYLLFYGKIAINPQGVLFFSIAGLFNSFLSRGAFLMAIPYIGVSRAGVFKITSPMFAILGGVLILHEVLSGQALLGTVIIILGIFLISLETAKRHQPGLAVPVDNAGGVPAMPKTGIMLGLLCGLMLGTGNVFRKMGINYIPSSILGATLGSLAALCAIVIFHAATGKAKELLHATKGINKNYVVSGFFSSIALYCMFIALKYLPVSYANSIGASESLFTMLWSVIIFGNKEILTIRTIISAVVVIAGIIIMIFS